MPTAAPLRILVTDDEARQREIVSEILTDAGHTVVAADSGASALTELERAEFDLLVTDLRMPGMDGVTLLGDAKRRQASLTVILMTAFATVDSAIEAMKNGAHDYLQKPFTKDELLQRVARVAERVSLVRENERLQNEIRSREAPEIIGSSPAMIRLASVIDRIAGAPGDVLITGESGTGKELVARRIHYSSPRAAGPFVPVNCAAIPESLAESELFGHEKGAFTHATSARPGRFEQAAGGTLFLDELSSMPQSLQPKLLRVLGDRVLERVGGTRARKIDVRVLTATNRDLRELVAAGRFREDLYHRVNVLEVHLPPLRDRREDIRELAERFRDRAAARYQVPPPDLTDELYGFFATYPFTGNVRELEHLIEKMVVLSEGEPLGVSDLPPSIDLGAARSAPASGDDDARGASAEQLLQGGSVSLADVERRLLSEAIRLSNGNLADAAKRLGISYKTMRYRARKFGLSTSD